MKGECVLCGPDADGLDNEFCFICPDLRFVCVNCMAQHLTDTHTQAEFIKAQRELLA